MFGLDILCGISNGGGGGGGAKRGGAEPHVGKGEHKIGVKVNIPFIMLYKTLLKNVNWVKDDGRRAKLCERARLMIRYFIIHTEAKKTSVHF